jgi:hypothetical protein
MKTKAIIHNIKCGAAKTTRLKRKVNKQNMMYSLMLSLFLCTLLSLPTSNAGQVVSPVMINDLKIIQQSRPGMAPNISMLVNGVRQDGLIIAQPFLAPMIVGLIAPNFTCEIYRCYATFRIGPDGAQGNDLIIDIQRDQNQDGVVDADGTRSITIGQIGEGTVFMLNRSVAMTVVFVKDTYTWLEKQMDQMDKEYYSMTLHFIAPPTVP